MQVESPDPFKGVVLVARQASSQAQVIFHYPESESSSPDMVFGIGAVEFGKLSLPAKWLMNRKLDFEIESGGPAISSHTSSAISIDGFSHLRFISFPSDCEHSSVDPADPRPFPIVSAFNIVFVFDSRHLSEEYAELYWQALATLSRAVLSEEHRCLYLSEQVSYILSSKSTTSRTSLSLFQLLCTVFEGLRLPGNHISLYVNDSILTHIGVVPFNQAPEPPSGHQALLLTCSPDQLQTTLPVDSASNVRRLIDAADPSRTIKDHMIDLGLPISTIQRLSQHLVYWRKAKIVHPLHKKVILALSPTPEGREGIFPSLVLVEKFRSKFSLRPAQTLPIWFKVLYWFCQGLKLADVKEQVAQEIPQFGTKFTELCVFLLQNQILSYSGQYFRYFPPLAPGPLPGSVKRFGPASQRPKFQNSLPPEIRSEYSPMEFEIIFDRLNYNSVASDLMIRLISNYVKRHKDLMTARIELSEQHRCSAEDFHKHTEALIGGYMDGLLVKYDCDL